jgi:hypothetical protein
VGHRRDPWQRPTRVSSSLFNFLNSHSVCYLCSPLTPTHKSIHTFTFLWHHFVLSKYRMISDILPSDWHLFSFILTIWFMYDLCCARWRTLTQSVGRISQPFRLKLEFTEGKKIPSHAAVDNIRLLSCLTGRLFRLAHTWI